MTALNPIVEHLEAAGDDAARAHWLLTVPRAILLAEQLEIRAILNSARFDEGLAYLSSEISALHARRDERGQLPATVSMAVSFATVGLEIIARGGDPGCCHD